MRHAIMMRLQKIYVRFVNDMSKFDIIGYYNKKNKKIENKDIDVSEILDKIVTNDEYDKTFNFGGSNTKIVIQNNYLSIIIQNNNGTDMSFETVLDDKIRKQTKKTIKEFCEEINDELYFSCINNAHM